ncbi:alpha/beta fold hydrolase [Kribbella sp. NPDC058693]|uniref:alpha/beta fold hydrolase n=1 Tax=Kribbella sp. NPDC058693 TaxID=3346602 RepID=UPI00364A2216
MTERQMSDPTRYGRLAGDSYGVDDERAPLVLLHGLTYDRQQWNPVLEELRTIDDRRRVLAVDLPGHGDSGPLASYGANEVSTAIHQAVEDAGITAPIVVGHSLGGALATTYAGQYPVRGVVNIDQPLLVGGFGDFLRGVDVELRGTAYRDVWESLLSQLKIDMLPAAAQELLRTATTPRQDLLLGYWNEIMMLPPDELAARRIRDLETIRANGTPYHHISGDELSPHYRTWLESLLPQLTVTVVRGSGHFPHLAHPTEVAKILSGRP